MLAYVAKHLYMVQNREHALYQDHFKESSAQTSRVRVNRDVYLWRLREDVELLLGCVCHLSAAHLLGP